MALMPWTPWGCPSFQVGMGRAAHLRGCPAPDHHAPGELTSEASCDPSPRCLRTPTHKPWEQRRTARQQVSCQNSSTAPPAQAPRPGAPRRRPTLQPHSRRQCLRYGRRRAGCVCRLVPASPRGAWSSLRRHPRQPLSRCPLCSSNLRKPQRGDALPPSGVARRSVAGRPRRGIHPSLISPSYSKSENRLFKSKESFKTCPRETFRQGGDGPLRARPLLW